MTILSSIILTVTTPENVNLANSESTIKSTILQVMLHHSSSNTEVLVYALLNTQSNTNFVTWCLICLVIKLNWTWQLWVSVNVPTMAVKGLEIKSVVNGSYIWISSCCLWDSVPCKREIIPTADGVSKWPHFSHINIPQIYEEIGLLSGYFPQCDLWRLWRWWALWVEDKSWLVCCGCSMCWY